MTWMNKAAGGFPLYLDRGPGAPVTDIDGHEYVDFCLGDTGAMAGHSPARRSAAVGPARDAAAPPRCCRPRTRPGSASELARRFGLPRW